MAEDVELDDAAKRIQTMWRGKQARDQVEAIKIEVQMTNEAEIKMKNDVRALRPPAPPLPSAPAPPRPAPPRPHRHLSPRDACCAWQTVTRVNDYRIGKKLGQGAYGMVLKGSKDHKDYAIKV